MQTYVPAFCKSQEPPDLCPEDFDPPRGNYFSQCRILVSQFPIRFSKFNPKQKETTTKKTTARLKVDTFFHERGNALKISFGPTHSLTHIYNLLVTQISNKQQKKILPDTNRRLPSIHVCLENSCPYINKDLIQVW